MAKIRRRSGAKRLHQATARGRRGRRSQSPRRAQRCLCAGRRQARRGRLMRRGQRHHARHHRMDHRGLQRFSTSRAPKSSATTSSRSTRPFTEARESCRSPAPAPTPSAARPTAAFESAGGWSSRLGDEGSGYWIGLHAIRRALHAYDRDEPTQILKKVGEIWGTPDMDRAHQRRRRHARAGFRRAGSRHQRAGRSRRPGSPRRSPSGRRRPRRNCVYWCAPSCAASTQSTVKCSRIPVAWTGSVIGKMPIVREAFFAGLRAAAPAMPVETTETVALNGAIWRAQRIAEQTS